jgi:hypothetical protein
MYNEALDDGPEVLTVCLAATFGSAFLMINL